MEGYGLNFEAIMKRFGEYLSAIKINPARLETLKKNTNRFLLILIMLSIAFGASNFLLVAIAAGALVVLLSALTRRK